MLRELECTRIHTMVDRVSTQTCKCFCQAPEVYHEKCGIYRAYARTNERETIGFWLPIEAPSTFPMVAIAVDCNNNGVEKKEELRSTAFHFRCIP